jgi:uncharacterized protein (DUF169 family)
LHGLSWDFFDQPGVRSYALTRKLEEKMSLYDTAELNEFLATLGYQEQPMAVFYTDKEPAEGLTPKQGDTPTLEKERAGQIDWGAVFGNFSCAMGHVWRARKKHTQAWFSAERFGCPGGAFYLGFLKPQTDAICAYVSSGVPGAMEGEHYISDPQTCRRVFEEMDPPLAGGKYCVFKPLDLLALTRPRNWSRFSPGPRWSPACTCFRAM